MINRYDHAKFIIERFDHYYDTVNSKGSFYIGLNTFILGGLCAGYITIASKVIQGYWFWALLVTIFVLCMASIIYTINAISPFTKDNESKDTNGSLIFFGGISKYSFKDFLEKYEMESTEKTEDDMFRQVHCLAKGLNTKFKKLRVVSNLLLLQFLTIIILFLYTIKNYTP